LKRVEKPIKERKKVKKVKERKARRVRKLRNKSSLMLKGGQKKVLK